jgi:D-tyrosyl-tRNA(Tyr) deacylase
MCEKTANLRILDDGSGQMQCSPRTLLADGSDIGILVVSQFTLYGDARKGRRPNYVRAAPGATAAPMVEACVAWFQDEGFRVRTGEFGAHMLVTLANDGPVTMLLDSDEMRVPGCSESDSHG